MRDAGGRGGVTVVRFTGGGGGDYAVPVGDTREVRPARSIVPLPGSRPEVAGLVAWRDEMCTVLAPLGASGDHVIMLDAGLRRFGLLVGAVTGVVRVDDQDLGPAPVGQDGGLVSGVIRSGPDTVLLLNVAVLAARLDASEAPS